MCAIRSSFLLLGSLLMMAAIPASAGEAPADALSQLPAHIALDQRFHVSAQPSAEALVKLPAAGVRTVINLRPPAETPDLDEKAVVEKAGMKYLSLPIAGAAGLTREEVESGRYFRIVNIQRLLKSGQLDKALQWTSERDLAPAGTR